MRLRLHPDVVVARRDPASIQIGLGGDSGVILELSPAAESLLAALRTGEHSLASLRRLATDRGIASTSADRIVDALREHGVLLADQVVPLVRPRAALLPVARSVALRRPGTDGWMVVNHRLTTTVLLVGLAYFGGRLARQLLGAGIGEVKVHDPLPVVARDLVEGEVYLPSDLGRPRQQVLADRLPGVTVANDPATVGCRLAVLIGSGVLDPLVWDPHVRADRPHLPLVLGERDVSIGPLVLPGRTCCLRCVELYRSDRDPSWPTVAAQAYSHAFGPRDPLLLDLACATAAAQVLLVVEDPTRSVLEGVSLEVGLDNPVPTLRRWPAHPRCGCTWPPPPRRADLALVRGGGLAG